MLCLASAIPATYSDIADTKGLRVRMDLNRNWPEIWGSTEDTRHVFALKGAHYSTFTHNIH